MLVSVLMKCIKNMPQLDNKITGLIPPQSVEFERLVLAALMIDSKVSDEFFSIIRTPEVFFKYENQLIYKAISDLWTKGEPIDIATVAQQLRVNKDLDKVGGDVAIIQMTQGVFSSANLEFHSRILLQYYVKRMVIMFNAKITALAYDDSTDIFDLLSRWQKEFDKVTDLTQRGRKTIEYADAIDHLREEIVMLSKNTDDVPLVGITTGLKRTDRHTGGYRNQDLVIIAARPGMGKTAKVLKTAIENVKKGIPVGFISLEMSVHQLTARSVAIDTSFHLTQLLKKGFEHVNYFVSFDDHAKRMKEYPLYIDDSGQSDISDVVITAKMWKRVFGIKLLIVDYLQLMTDKSNKGNRENEISTISRRLKMLAKELDIPVIALSQLSRAVETRGGSKRPMLSDLRESGAIEQDADIVEFIYRPGYYQIDMNVADYDNPKDVEAINNGANTEIIYAKYRGGSLGVALVKWVGDKTKFVDVEDPSDTADVVNNILPHVNPTDAFDNPFVEQSKTVFDG